MPDERWVRVKELFAAGLELDVESREALLARQAADDSEREQVRALLRSHDAAAGFMDAPALAAALHNRPPRPPLGRMIGPYRLEREIGHGGMGAVYLAARADGTFDKQVALKVVPRGFDTEEILRRFRQERQTLASLDHPNIARLLDAGATDEGLPYFVMEYVEGVSIDRYCDERSLSVADRLGLFVAVCGAVHAAHQRLVVHRDLKPDNILITAEGVPKLVDFGIAKVLATTGDVPPETRGAERLMTPEYASPEQRLGGAITTATDVFSLGVLLYELLTGRLPRSHAPGQGLVDWDGREFPVEMPSTVVLAPMEVKGADGQVRRIPPATLSSLRRASPAALRRQLIGDLDAIVAQAMRWEPNRRYASVEQFAADVSRHVASVPVLARQHALAYRMAKFVRRHAPAVATAACLVVALAAGVAGVAWQAAVAAEQRDRARVEAEKAGQISAFLQEMLSAPDPANSGRTVRVADTLDRAAKRLDTDAVIHPEVRAALHRALGTTYAGLGLYETGATHLRAALDALSETTTDAAADRAAIQTELADAVSAVGETEAAETLYRHALAAFDALGLAEDLRRANALNGLGALLRERGDDAGAEARYREALGIRRRLLGERDVAVAESLNNLAVVMHGRNDLAGAERLYRESLAIVRAARGDDHPGVPAILSNLATVVGSRGDLAAAEPLYREALAIRRRVLGEDHPDVTFSMYGYADTLYELGRHREAAALCREVLARRGHSLPGRHPIVAASLLVLGKSLLEEGHHREAESVLREALAIRKAILPAGHWQTASAASAVGRCLTVQGRYREAEALLVGAYERLKVDRGPRHERTLDALQNVIDLYEAWRKPERAASYRVSEPS